MKYEQPDGQMASKLPFFHPLSRRLHIVLLILAGIFAMSCMRMNIGISMTCMVNSTAVTIRALEEKVSYAENLTHIVDIKHTQKVHKISGKCGIAADGEKIANDYGGTFEWNPTVQGYIFAAGFYGSLLTLIPSGILADLWSPVMMLEIASVFLIVCTGLTPIFATYFGPWSVFALRFAMGLGEGFILPSTNKLASQWIPNEEKSTAISMYTSGNQLGGIVGIPFFAYLCGSDIGWPGIFYVSAAIGTIWLIFWHYMVTPSPAKCKTMTDRERAFLNSKPELKNSRKNQSWTFPAKAIFTSPAFISLMACSFAVNVIASIVQIYLPTFLKEVLFLGAVDNGFFSAAPPAAQFITKMGWSITIDHFKSKGLSPTTAVKISQSITSFGAGTMFILIGRFANCETPYLTLLLLCLNSVCFATATSGFFTSMVSLAPSYTGIITSFCFLFGVLGRSAPTIFIPYFNKTGTLEEWQNVFNLTAGILFASGICFCIFGSGLPQEWGIAKESKNIEEAEKMTLENQGANQLGSMMLETVNA
jgi:MFS family permease